MVWYCNRESVKSALFEMDTARSNAQIDDAISYGALDVDGLLKWSSIAPTLATRTFPYPSRSTRSPSWRLWLDQHPLLQALTVTTANGTVTVSVNDYILQPDDAPYNEIQINLGGGASWDSGSTWQRATRITGLWGLGNDRLQVGTLASQLGATAGATASLTWSTARVGVGDVLFIDDEAVVISERSMVDSAQNLGADLAQDEAGTLVTVADGSAFAVDEVLLIGAERMLVVDIAGNSLAVKRAWDGSQLAAHSTGADIYALTGVTLDRAQLGTTIASHASTTAVYRWQPPADIGALNRGYAIAHALDERSGMARALSASSDTAVEVSGRSLAKLESDVERRWGRGPARHRAIV